MSLFGSLFTGVSALNVQSQSMAIISNNIANVNTTGFKRAEAAFFSLVTSESRLTRYSPGTVAVNRIQRVNQQGPIQQTSSSTDVAVSGNGMIPVKRSTDSGQEYLYTRSGSFSEDAQGLLRNTAGFVLYAWPIDSNGNLPAAQGDLTSLVPADVAFLGGLTRPTNVAEMSINLNAAEVDQNPHTYSTPAQLPIPGTQNPDFSRTLRVYDTLGSAQDMTLQFRKIVGPMAYATSGTSALEGADLFVGGTSTPAIAAGNQFSVTVPVSAVGPAITRTYTFVAGAPAAANEVQTVQDLLDEIAADFPNRLELRLDDSGRLVFQNKDIRDTFTLANVAGTPLTAANTLEMIPDPSDADLTYDAEAPTSGPYLPTDPYPDQGDFPAFQNANDPNTQGWWQMTVMHPDGSTLSEGLLNFNGDGTINATPNADGNIRIALTAINWGNGSDPQDIEVDVERFSQFQSESSVIFSDQDGAELGLRTGVEINREGEVIARFSNGASATLYKVPLVTFASVNGLKEISGTAYSETEESGEENLREAGTGGAGFFEPSTTENSNVDLADEFAKMIITQRAFSAGTKVINTADQMTEELLRLR